MLDELKALVKLSQIDDSASELDKELAEIPARMNEMRDNVQKLEGLLANEREQLKEAEGLKAAQDAQVAESNDKISKAKAKGAKATNAKEADAAERELDSIRRSLRDREEEQKRLGEAIEKVRASLEQHESEFQELKNLFIEDEKKANERLAELNAERDKVLEGRDVQVAKVDKTTVKRYERLRSQRGSGMAEAADGICRACRIHILPQQYITIQRGESIEQCHNCNRFLYYKPAVLEGQPAPDA